MKSSVAGRERCRQGAGRTRGVSPAGGWYLSGDSGSGMGSYQLLLDKGKRQESMFVPQLVPEPFWGDVRA